MIPVLKPSDEAGESAKLVFEVSTRLHAPTSLVIGPDWTHNIQRSLASKIARFVGADARLIYGVPDRILQEIRTIGREARHDVQLIVMPYVLHDFAHGGHDVSAVIAELTELLPHANALVADYAFENPDEATVLQSMTTELERRRMRELGTREYFEEHSTMTPKKLEQAINVFPFSQSVRFSTRRVLFGSHQPVFVEGITEKRITVKNGVKAPLSSPLPTIGVVP